MLYKIVLAFALSLQIFAQDSLLFIIRVDDIQSRNTALVPSSITYFQSAVEQRGGKVTWAVIPHRLIEAQNANGLLLKDLKQTILRGHEIAMHGYNHICTNCGASGHEMFCATASLHFTYNQQSTILNNSLVLLSDSLHMHPTTFVPPGHHDDSTTWQALGDKGFEYISTNGPSKNFIHRTLFNLKQHQEYTWQLTSAGYGQKLSEALADIRAAAKTDGYFCMLFHDPFIRQGYENGLVVRWVGELLDSINLQFAGKVQYLTLKDAAARFRAQVIASVDGNVNELPSKMILEQNFPNPFNSTTEIRYQISAAGTISLNVYNMLGELIKTLESGHRNPGTYTASCNMTGQPSGIYLYRLEGAGTNIVKKLILLN